jgi:hypothetical protein
MAYRRALTANSARFGKAEGTLGIRVGSAARKIVATNP